MEINIKDFFYHNYKVIYPYVVYFENNKLSSYYNLLNDFRLVNVNDKIMIDIKRKRESILVNHCIDDYTIIDLKTTNVLARHYLHFRKYLKDFLTRVSIPENFRVLPVELNPSSIVFVTDEGVYADEVYLITPKEYNSIYYKLIDVVRFDNMLISWEEYEAFYQKTKEEIC